MVSNFRTIFITSIIWVTCSYAAYLTNVPQVIVQPDGSIIECFASGDEYVNWLHDENGFTIIRSQEDGYYYYAVKDGDYVVPSQFKVGEVNPSQVGIKKGIKVSKRIYDEKVRSFKIGYEKLDAPTSGTINNLNIFIRFSDEPEFSTPRSYFDGFFNEVNGPSLRHYYNEVSYEVLEVITHHYPLSDFTTNRSYQDSHPRSYYQPYNASANPNGYVSDDDRRIREHTLLKNAVEFVESEIPDTLTVDSDGDGYVDNVTFLVYGSPGAWASLLWPHRWALYTFDVFINGSQVYDYNLNLASGGYFTVAVICHEFFHTLGAPDLYHYWDDTAPTAVGGWDIMDQNSNPPQYMGAFMKYKYGDWIEEIPLISTAGIYTLNPLSSPTNNCYKINSPNSVTEFFIIEYRQKAGLYEINTPGDDSGLLVYRINTLAGDGNADGPPDEIYVYRVNGTLTNNGDFSQAPFNQSSGRTEINDSTNPSSFLSNGNPGGLNITDVGYAGTTIQFKFPNLYLHTELSGLIDGGDGDGLVNPGENFILQLTVSNASPTFDVNNIIGYLFVEGAVSIPDNEIFFGDLNAGGSEAAYDLEVTFEPEIPLGNVQFVLQLTANFYDGGELIEYSDEFPFSVNVTLNQTGWPFLSNYQVESSPAIIDINDDGTKEIIFGDYNGLLHVLNSSGQELIDFPFDLGDDIWGSPAIADLDNDGGIEIIIGSKNKHLYILNADGSVQLNFNAQQYLMGTPALGDIDGDAELEIIFGGYSSAGKVFALNPDGSAVNGFPVLLGEKIQRGVALADFNGNEKVDIVCGTDNENIYLIYDDGTVADGFPFTAGNDFRTAPSILDANGEKIIFAGSRDDSFYALNSDGSLRFEIATGGDVNTSPGFVETANGPLIFFGSDDGFLYSVRTDGTSHPGWPQSLGSDVIAAPVFADLDGDGGPEVISATNGGELFAFRLDGSLYTHFPIGNEIPFQGSLIVEDIDLDSDLDIFIGTISGVAGIDVKETGSAVGYWNMHRGNLHRTGYYESSQQPETIIVTHFADWNLLGLPLNVEDSNYLTVYPDAIEGTLYSFATEYIQESDLTNGTGYWLRFTNDGVNTITGMNINSLTVDLVPDWNLISGISSPVNVNNVSDPDELIIPGTFYGFTSEYVQTGILEPGQGYWVRSDGTGMITISNIQLVKRKGYVNRLKSANTISFNGQTLYFGVNVPEEEKLSYSLPPQPPSGAFDVRFTGDWKYCETSGEIEVMNNSESLEISYDVRNEENWLLMNSVSQEEYVLSGTGTISVFEDVDHFRLEKQAAVNIPDSYALKQNYPNPFNPITTISYQLPEAVLVNISIYNVSGQLVTTLVNEQKNSGNYVTEWDASGVGSGIYFYQLKAGEYSEVKKCVIVK